MRASHEKNCSASAMGNERPGPMLSWRKFEAGCFAAGTLVHTQEGLKPIEQIKVGDMVLSKHESGQGERTYKRVTKTFVHEDAEIVQLGFMEKDIDGKNRWIEGVFVTPNHPIWVIGKGWKEAGTMRATYPRPTKFEAVEGTNVHSGHALKLHSTKIPGVVFMATGSKMEASAGKGILFDLVKNTTVRDDANPNLSKGAYWSEVGGAMVALP